MNTYDIVKKYSKSSRQKGFSPLFIIIGIVAVGAISFILFNTRNSSRTNNSPATTEVENSTQTTSDKIDEKNFTFYYPKTFKNLILLDKKRGPDTVLYYGKPDNEDVAISLAVSSKTTRNDTPSMEYCNEFLQFSLRSNKNVRIVEVKPVDFEKSHGCDYTYIQDSPDKKLVFHEKDLWFKEGSDFSVYAVMASYLTTDPQEDKNILDDAVNQFILKYQTGSTKLL